MFLAFLKRARVILPFMFCGLVSVNAFAQSENSCRLTTPDACSSYRKAASDSFPAAFNAQAIEVEMLACKNDPAFQKACGQCLDRLSRFAASYGRFRENGMGFSKPNNEYLNAQEDTRRFPAGMMQIPAELLTLKDQPEDAEGAPEKLVGDVVAFPLLEMYQEQFTGPAWDALAAQGYRSLVYSSRTVPNPPNKSYRRLLVYVPGEAFDRWIQFTLPDVVQPGTQEYLIDFIAVQKKDILGASLAQLQLHFRQYTRKFRNGVISGLERRDQSVDKCYSCHTGGMRALSPDPGSISGAQGLETLAFYNEKMMSYGKPGFGGEALEPLNFGPALGQSTGCTDCHGQASESWRLPLTWPVWAYGNQGGIQTIKHKIMVDFSMPPNSMIQEMNKVVDLVSQLEPEPSQSQADFLLRFINVTQVEKYDEILKVAAEKQLLPSEEIQALTLALGETKTQASQTYQNFEAGVESDLRNWFNEEPCTPLTE